jgi:Zn-dependent protease with chaperone function
MNAFVLPGGKIFVFTGILRVTADEHGLAAVLGHEIAHQYARHTAEKASLFQLAFMLKFLLAFFVDTSFLFNPLLVQLGVNLPFSRKCETEADYLGLMLMAQACYDPREAVQFWERMSAAKEGQGVEWASTHPIPRNRIAKIKEWMPQAINRYHLSNCGQTGSDFRELHSKLFKF